MEGLAFERQYCTLAFAASALSVGCAGHATDSNFGTALQLVGGDSRGQE